MPILHTPIQQEFTILPNAMIRDSGLKLRDLGLLTFMLSLPPDWRFTLRGMEAVLPGDGLTAIRTSVSNLERLGYLERAQNRDGSGAFEASVWTVRDSPMCENPITGSPSPGTRTQTKKRKNKEKKNKEKIYMHNNSSISSFTAPTVQEVESCCAAEGLHVNAELFVNYYQARGWELSPGRPMRDWKSCLKVWEMNRRQEELPQPEFYTGGNEWADRL